MSKEKNKIFWNKFYKKKLDINKPSNFAKFILKFLKKKTTIVDVGCGNGRDIFFFKKNKINFYGIDLSKSATIIIKKKLRNKMEKKKIFQEDFTKFNYDRNIKNKFSIYSRFTWHSIDSKKEKIFLKKISKISKLEYLFIETRSDKDNLFGVGKKVGKNEFITDHYRRFINKNNLIKKLKKNFNIIYLKESKGLSKFKKEDPCLIRFIGEKKQTQI